MNGLLQPTQHLNPLALRLEAATICVPVKRIALPAVPRIALQKGRELLPIRGSSSPLWCLLVAQPAFERLTQRRIATFNCCHPRSYRPRRIVPDMLLMPTSQLSHPMAFVVLMKPSDLSEHGRGVESKVLFSSSQDCHTAGATARRRDGAAGRGEEPLAKRAKLAKESSEEALGSAPMFLTAAPATTTRFKRGAVADVRLPRSDCVTLSLRHPVTLSEVIRTGSTGPKC